MKGINLPSNVMYYLAITLIVIAAVIVLMICPGGYCPKEDYFFLMKAGCFELIKNCDDPDWQNIMIEGKTKTYTLGELCTLNNIKIENCKHSCGCSTTTTII